MPKPGTYFIILLIDNNDLQCPSMRKRCSEHVVRFQPCQLSAELVEL